MNMITATCGNHQWDPIPFLCSQLHLLSYFTNFFINEQYIGKVWDSKISEINNTIKGD